MPTHDIKPIVVFVAILSSLLGTLLLRLWKYSNYYHGINFWAIGCFCSSASLILASVYPFPGEYINLMLFNLIFISGQCSILAGIWKFKEKKVNYYFVVILPLVSLVQVTYFTIIYPAPGVRVAVNSLLYASYGIYAFIELLRPPEKSLTFAFRINSLLYLIYVFVMIIRSVRSYSSEYINFLAFTPLNVLFFVLMSGLQLVLAYGFIIIVNTRLAEDLRKQLMVRDKMFSIIGHDLKSSVNVVSGFSELLHKSIDSEEIEKSKRFAGYVRQASIQMSGILSNLLGWAASQSKVDIFMPEELDIRSLIEEEVGLINSIAANKQIIIDYREVTSMNMMADRNMLKTIIRNLIINAIKYTNTGGKISVSGKQITDNFEISVSDSGIGIEPENIPKLFNIHDRITTKGTAQENGSGLGLLLCKEFVERHNGKIWVESIVEQGSTFKFTIPVAPTPDIPNT